jgi:hypothetical protein
MIAKFINSGLLERFALIFGSAKPRSPWTFPKRSDGVSGGY